MFTNTPTGLVAFLRRAQADALKSVENLKKELAKEESVGKETMLLHLQHHMRWYAVDFLGELTFAEKATRWLAEAPDFLKELTEVRTYAPENEELNKREEAVEWYHAMLMEAQRMVMQRINPASRSTSPASNFSEDYEHAFAAKVLDYAGEEARFEAAKHHYERMMEERAKDKAERDRQRLEQLEAEAAKKEERKALSRKRNAERKLYR